MGKVVTVRDITAAREKRTEKVRILFGEKNCAAVIQLTLNIPGNRKNSGLYLKIFREGVCLIEKALDASHMCFQQWTDDSLFTGAESYFSVTGASPDFIKKLTAEIEEKHPLGRIFDIDVFSSPAEKISSDRGLRKCYICAFPAFECARAGSHSVAQLLQHITNTALKYFAEIERK